MDKLAQYWEIRPLLKENVKHQADPIIVKYIMENNPFKSFLLRRKANKHLTTIWKQIRL